MGEEPFLQMTPVQSSSSLAMSKALLAPSNFTRPGHPTSHIARRFRRRWSITGAAAQAWGARACSVLVSAFCRSELQVLQMFLGKASKAGKVRDSRKRSESPARYKRALPDYGRTLHDAGIFYKELNQAHEER